MVTNCRHEGNPINEGLRTLDHLDELAYHGQVREAVLSSLSDSLSEDQRTGVGKRVIKLFGTYTGRTHLVGRILQAAARQRDVLSYLTILEDEGIPRGAQFYRRLGVEEPLSQEIDPFMDKENVANDDNDDGSSWSAP